VETFTLINENNLEGNFMKLMTATKYFEEPSDGFVIVSNTFVIEVFKANKSEWFFNNCDVLPSLALCLGVGRLRLGFTQLDSEG